MLATSQKMLKCTYSKFGAISALSTVSSYAYSKNMAACCAHILGAVCIQLRGATVGKKDLVHALPGLLQMPSPFSSGGLSVPVSEQATSSVCLI